VLKPESLEAQSSILAEPWWLAINRFSNNVGGVKYFLGALVHALRRVRHFFTIPLATQAPSPQPSRVSQNRIRGTGEGNVGVSKVKSPRIPAD
jgi:hypothetical protein